MAGMKSPRPDSRRASIGGAASAIKSRSPAAPTRSVRKAPAGSIREAARDQEGHDERPHGERDQRAPERLLLAEERGRRYGHERAQHQADEAHDSGREPALRRRGLGHQAVRGASHEDRERRHAGKDVARQLRRREREERERQQQPQQHETVGERLARRRAHEAGDREPRPREEADQQHRQVVPERAGVVVDRGREALEVVVQQEDRDEALALVAEDRHVPGRRDDQEGEDRERAEELAEPAPLARREQEAAHARGREAAGRAGPSRAWRRPLPPRRRRRPYARRCRPAVAP